MRLCLDSNAIIYSVESALPFRQQVLARIGALQGGVAGTILTSRLSMLECRVKPLRDRNSALVTIYDQYFMQPSLHLMEISPTVIDRATELRVRYRFKTADSIHLATAVEGRADYFVTGDRDLVRCTDVRVELI